MSTLRCDEGLHQFCADAEPERRERADGKIAAFQLEDVPQDAFVDPGKVNVIFTSGDGQEETILMDDRDCETEADGWQYTSDAKEKIVLCGDACQRVRAEFEGHVHVVFRCRDTEVK